MREVRPRLNLVFPPAIALIVLSLAAGCAPDAGEVEDAASGEVARVAIGRVAAGDPALSIEYIAHASFRIRSPDGRQIIIDPFADRVWLGYDFPADLEADAVLITHPHYDHDAGQRMGRDFPWTGDVPVMTEPGSYSLSDLSIRGIEGKHADPYGVEFGQTNTIWMVESAGIRLAHLGDNGPLTDANIEELGRVDILMMPADGVDHILSREAQEAILAALDPKVLIPMHYRLPDLEADADKPDDLGDLDPWLEGRERVLRLERHIATTTAAGLPEELQILVFPHSPAVVRPTT